MAKRQLILDRIKDVFRKYGFMPLETPAMENLATLSGKYGDEGDQLLFRILNSGDYLKDVAPGTLQSKDTKSITSAISTETPGMGVGPIWARAALVQTATRATENAKQTARERRR